MDAVISPETIVTINPHDQVPYADLIVEINAATFRELAETSTGVMLTWRNDANEGGWVVGWWAERLAADCNIKKL